MSTDKTAVDAQTIAERIMRDAKLKVYPYTHVLSESHTQRVGRSVVDPDAMTDTYTFEDGSKIVCRVSTENGN